MCAPHVTDVCVSCYVIAPVLSLLVLVFPALLSFLFALHFTMTTLIYSSVHTNCRKGKVVSVYWGRKLMKMP